MGQLVDDSEKSPGHACMTWRLNAVGPNTVAGPIMPGIYALQNKASETFVSLSPDESTVSCWPADQLEKTGVKLVSVLTGRICGDDNLLRPDTSGRYCPLARASRFACMAQINTSPCKRV